MANFEFRYGSMNSGKSMALMQVAYNYEENGMKVLVVKSKVDTKAKDHLVSRIGPTRKVDILLDKDDSLLDKKYDKYLKGIECILVDEAQFLTTKQIEDLWYIAKIKDIHVLCYGLKTDFTSKLFEGSKRLFELADSYIELVTICSCGKKARFNARKVNGKYTTSGDSVMIDGENKKVEYIPLCGKCYMQKVLKIK